MLSRQIATIGILVLAGLASIATSKSPPGLSTEVHDQIVFTSDQPTQVRHLRVRVEAAAEADVNGYIQVSVPYQAGRSPVTATVVRESDGRVVSRDFWGGDQSYTETFSGELRWASPFYRFDPCLAGKVCDDLYTVTYSWTGSGTDKVLADIYIQVTAQYLGIDLDGSPPPGGSLTADYGP